MLRFKQFLIEQNSTSYVDYSRPTPVKEFEEDYNSPEYFDSLNKKFVKLKTGERVELSPFDVMSLQFGKDKVKERDEYLEKLKDYHKKNPEAQNYVETPTLSDEHLKERIPFINSPVEKSQATHKPEVRSFAKDIGLNVSPESIERSIRTTQQPEDIKTSSYITINPSILDTHSDDQIKSVLSHESWHRLAYPNYLKNKKEKDLKTPVDIAQKYDIDPTFNSIIAQMHDKYFEREKELQKVDLDLEKDNSGLNYLWGLVTDSSAERLSKSKERENKSAQNAIRKENLRKYVHTNISGLEMVDKLSDAYNVLDPKLNKNNYFWNRNEVPAFMHQLKIDLMKQTNQPYRTADQSDESIDSDADFLINQKLDPDNTNFSPGEIKALQLLKTPEGKAIWKGVQKSAPEKDRRYA